MSAQRSCAHTGEVPRKIDHQLAACLNLKKAPRLVPEHNHPLAAAGEGEAGVGHRGGGVPSAGVREGLPAVARAAAVEEEEEEVAAEVSRKAGLTRLR